MRADNILGKSLNELLEGKWRIFERRIKLFRHIPFVDFILLQGSMATGKVREESDFDLIIGARSGRVWTTWFLATLFLQLRGWREHPGVDKKNRISLSHFASPKGYKFSEPYDAYWNDLYQKLIPVMGDEEKLAEFFRANDWLKPAREYRRHEKYFGNKKSWDKRCWEMVLGGRVGNWTEKLLKKWLMKRVKNPAKLGYKPRVHWDDDRIELYRDTKRIEEMLKRGLYQP